VHWDNKNKSQHFKKKFTANGTIVGVVGLVRGGVNH
jgi:hypothetical protein